jgi:hypothetical protein
MGASQGAIAMSMYPAQSFSSEAIETPQSSSKIIYRKTPSSSDMRTELTLTTAITFRRFSTPELTTKPSLRRGIGKARRSKLEFEVVLVQPGASVATISDDSLRLLATTELYLLKTTRARMRVILSP